uniref:Uncharacterized protein n=1 Tax=Chromera velia CCMP2878 TaxID=1169474 RepID=A0A0G4HTU6_9ALVE|eukprot:Cvel_31588.t1-p1 / transcript=Cvel_31588.t1 / gene=Cvel_31588 / organism=Chromera_velia_CCMP2878 / gene_product=hypothetical protein / transcript_product=hypothetical protein / location=Cvel_scaffold4736:222-6733(-) / protein_length=209 / sequence_SO=supercontig / SO=protein_coding / is_pseudo=false
MRNAILKEQAASFTDKKAILTVATKIAEVTGPPTTPSDFVDIIKNITQLEAAFSEEVIVQMNQNFMETLIRVKGTAKEDSLTVGAGRGSTSELFDAWLQILAYCHLRNADSGGDCIFPQLFKLMTTKRLKVMLVRRLSQPWHTGAVSFGLFVYRRESHPDAYDKYHQSDGAPDDASNFVDIIKNITQLEAAFTEEAIVQMNQNFMETLI